MLSNDEVKYLWENAIEELINEKAISEFENKMILNKIEVSNFENDTILLNASSNLALETFTKKMLDIFSSKINSLVGSSLKIDISLSTEKKQKNVIEEPAKEKSKKNTENTVKKEESISKTPTKKQVRTPENEKINLEYTFDNFIIFQNNEFAANAAKTVAKNPARTYNPLLIYGGVGLGKTHLMEAIGNEVLDNTNLKVLYVTSEDFLNEFIKCIQNGSMPDFKKKYRNVDYLLLDDIQFFENKEEVQNEFFNTFNHLYDTKKQMVFTCDKHPTSLKNLSDRLKSRFGQGLNVDIKAPSFESRCAILQKKLEIRNETLPDDVIKLIARNISSNIRDLNSALLRLTAFSNMTNQVLTVEKATAILEDSFTDKKQGNISLDNILKVVANYFDISVPDIRSKKRQQKISLARHYSMYLAKELTEMSTTEIGAEIGNRDHTTVLHSCQKIESMILSDPKVETTLEQLKNNLKSY